VFPSRYQLDRFADGGWRNLQWTGQPGLLQDWSDGEFPDEAHVAEPETTWFGPLAVIYLAGIVTRSGWLRLAAEIREAAAAPRTKTILLRICSVAQQIVGVGEVEDALAAAGGRVFTVAFLEVAYGVMLPLAHRARLVVAEPAASIGWMAGGYPWGKPANYPDEASIAELIWNFDDCRKPPKDSFLRDNFSNLYWNAMHAEQLERGGVVHHLADFERLMSLLCRKGVRR
jgi:hypothetical protein